MKRAVLFTVLLAGCARTIPDHLRREPAPTEAVADVAIDWSSADAALRTLLRGDPLARRPRQPDDPAVLRDLGLAAVADALQGLSALDQHPGDRAHAAQRLEGRLQGTVGAPFVRGYRLLQADQFLARFGSQPTALQPPELAVLLTALQPDAVPVPSGTHPLAFLGDGPVFASNLRRYGDRWALQGWLAVPDADLRPVAEALSAATFEDLRHSPLGRLVVARAEGRQGDVAAGLADLKLATSLALQRAAADRDAEQTAWETRRASLAAELGDPDPVKVLLERAAATLTDAAGDDRGAGGALLALAALRWKGRCGWEPCAGLDRASVFADAARWSPDLQGLARTWQIIALKEAYDGFIAGQGTVRFSAALVDLLDATLAVGAPPPQAGVLARRSPDAFVWQQLGALAGRDATTSWEDVKPALGILLAKHAEQAKVNADDETIKLLERIRRRASP